MNFALLKLVLCLTMVATCACRKDHQQALQRTEDYSNVFPARAAALLRSADTIQALSLDPSDRLDDPKGFHGWPIVGTVPILAKEHKALVDAIIAGVAPSDSPVALCFSPRHGVRAIGKEGVLDLVICFECNQVEVFYPEGGKDSYMPGYALAEPLSRIITKAGVAIVPSMSERMQQAPSREIRRGLPPNPSPAADR